MANINNKVRVGEVYFVLNSSLGLKNSKKGSGHYVYIKDINKSTNKCTVHTLTSMEYGKPYVKNNKLKYRFNLDRVNNIRKGFVQPLIIDNNLSRWTGINLRPLSNVCVSDIHISGHKFLTFRNKSIIQKFVK